MNVHIIISYIFVIGEICLQYGIRKHTCRAKIKGEIKVTPIHDTAHVHPPHPLIQCHNQISIFYTLQFQGILLSQWISSLQWNLSPAFYGNIKEFFLWAFGIHVYLVAESSYSIYLNMNIAYPWAFLRQVTNFTGVTKFTGWAVAWTKF